MTEAYLFRKEKETRRHTKKTHDDQRAVGKGGTLGANGHETGQEGKQLGRVQLFATPWAAACQDPPSMEFSRQEYWRGLPFHTLGDLLKAGIKPTSLVSPALADSLLLLHVLYYIAFDYSFSACICIINSSIPNVTVLFVEKVRVHAPVNKSKNYMTS